MSKEKKSKVEEKSLVVVCSDCGKSFKRSKFASNIKRCVKCAKIKRNQKLKDTNRKRKWCASLKNFRVFAGDKVADKVEKAIGGAGISKRYQYFLANYPDWVENRKKVIAKKYKA